MHSVSLETWTVVVMTGNSVTSTFCLCLGCIADRRNLALGGFTALLCTPFLYLLGCIVDELIFRYS